MDALITKLYTENEQAKYTDYANTVKYKNIDLNKLKKSELIIVIGDILSSLNEIEIKYINENKTKDLQDKINHLEMEKNILKNRVDNLTKQNSKLNIKKESITGPSGMLTVSDIIGDFGDGYKTWN
jgi:hypothetical protein